MERKAVRPVVVRVRHVDERRRAAREPAVHRWPTDAETQRTSSRVDTGQHDVHGGVFGRQYRLAVRHRSPVRVRHGDEYRRDVARGLTIVRRKGEAVRAVIRRRGRVGQVRRRAAQRPVRWSGHDRVRQW